MRPAAILSSALLLAATSSAWPSMLSNPVDAFKREVAPLLVARQANDDSPENRASSKSSSEVTESATSRTGDSESGSRTSASTSATATGDDNNDDENNDNENGSSSGTAKETGTAKSTGSDNESSSGTQSGSKTSSGTSKTSATNFDPRNPAGGASMITPDAMSPASYYKIKDQVTFAWNYTSLSRNPKYVDVLATCAQNNALYTIAANETWEQTQTIVWDTGNYQATATVPLLTETYTLIIHDAQKDISATASPGYLGTWKQFTFGMYVPREPTPLAGYVCATCPSSGAMSLMEKHTYSFLFSMVGVTILTFGWFTGAAGLW